MRNWRLEPDRRPSPRRTRRCTRASFVPRATAACDGPPLAAPGASPASHHRDQRLPRRLEPRADGAGVRRGGAAHSGGGDRAARRGVRAPACDSLCSTAATMFQGTPASNLAFGRPVVDHYNALGYAAAALGNHEFDWGSDTLRARMRDARYRDPRRQRARTPTGAIVPWIPDDTLIARRRLSVGVIGVADVETPRIDLATNVARPALRRPGADRQRARAGAARARRRPCGRRRARRRFCDGAETTECNGEIVDLARGVTRARGRDRQRPHALARQHAS